MMAQVLPSELFQEVLEQLDMLTSLNVKGVSKTWRTKARSVVWAWLCRREGQPVPASRVAVTDVDIEPFVKADGPDVAHVGEAMVRFPNLARMRAHGFVVDVAALRALGAAPSFEDQWMRRVEHPWGALMPVRSCIRCDEDEAEAEDGLPRLEPHKHEAWASLRPHESEADEDEDERLGGLLLAMRAARYGKACVCPRVHSP